MTDSVMKQTTLVPEVGKKKYTGELWKNQPATCWACQKEFKNINSLYSHLQHCRFRMLSRYYKLGTYLFTIQINPIKKRRNALQKVIDEFHDPKMFMGAISYLMNENIIRDFAAMQIVESKQMLAYPDGRVLYSMLKKLLADKELKLLQDQVSTLNEAHNKNRQAAGIKI